MTLPAGTSLSTYTIVELIGVGGMGEVYRARDSKLGRDVAVKTLPQALAEANWAERLMREARVLASLNHPNIATLFGFESQGDLHFLVMELVEGETLEERIRRAPPSFGEVLDLFTQIAEGIEAAHTRGVIHRDLKPANIKVVGQGRVKILDFGLAKAIAAESEGIPRSRVPRPWHTAAPANPNDRDAAVASFPFAALAAETLPSSVTKTGAVMGTPGYMSPEQAFGDPVGKPADLWAFGCCLFEALTGTRAFAGDTLHAMLSAIAVGQPDWTRLDDVPATVRDLIYHCLAKDQAERPKSASHLVERLRSARHHVPPDAATRMTPAPVSLERRLFDISQELLCVAGVDGFMKRVNPAFERTLGWSASDLYSRPFIEFVHEEDRDATIGEMRKLASGIPTHSFSNRYRRPDGTYQRLAWTAQLDVETGLIYAVARQS